MSEPFFYWKNWRNLQPWLSGTLSPTQHLQLQHPGRRWLPDHSGICGDLWCRDTPRGAVPLWRPSGKVRLSQPLWDRPSSFTLSSSVCVLLCPFQVLSLCISPHSFFFSSLQFCCSVLSAPFSFGKFTQNTNASSHVCDDFKDFGSSQLLPPSQTSDGRELG